MLVQPSLEAGPRAYEGCSPRFPPPPGAGIAIDGVLVRGITDNAGEWGHTLLMLDGRPCRCGRRGCVEAYVGAPGLRLTPAEVDPSQPALGQPGRRDFVEALAVGLAAGDPVLRELVRRTGRCLAAALGDLVNLLNVPKVVLTGWVPEALAMWLVPAVRDELPRHVLPGSLPGLTVEVSEVPGNAVCLGMGAAFALEQFLARLGLVGPARTRPQPGAGTAQPAG